jgi:hypothetical protein
MLVLVDASVAEWFLDGLLCLDLRSGMMLPQKVRTAFVSSLLILVAGMSRHDEIDSNPSLTFAGWLCLDLTMLWRWIWIGSASARIWPDLIMAMAMVDGIRNETDFGVHSILE